jgi:xanthine dehydrogenase molybdopterin-binding subunit B
LHKIQTQVSIDNSVVIHKTQKDNREFMEAKFGRILKVFKRTTGMTPYKYRISFKKDRFNNR